MYENGNIQQKRLIIGSMYPENLTFDGIQHRTTRLNEAMRWIYNVDKAFNENKNGKQADISHVSRLVAGTKTNPKKTLVQKIKKQSAIHAFAL